MSGQSSYAEPFSQVGELSCQCAMPDDGWTSGQRDFFGDLDAFSPIGILAALERDTP